MMVDNTENNEFRELLSDYAAPIEDDGFSQHVLTQAPSPRNTGAIKRTMIGTAALIAAIVSVPQLASLKHFISGIKLPEVSLNLSALNEMSISNAAIFALLAAMLIGLASSFWLNEDM
ncbi:MAG: hypothetical protein COA91_00915 [Robiginitomaculum sp.]|nr:MAG: hypothetical protein COA91_00915 [Robiginitomaculum sp.]